MEYSYGEKLKMAQVLRETSAVIPDISPELNKYVDLVNHQEKYIETQGGNTHFYIITPKEEKEIYPLYINLHGGGFVRAHKEKDTILCSKIAYNCGCKVIDVDYKVAPEYPFPIAFNECYDVVKWAFANAQALNIDKERIVLGGYSAGASFTTAIMLKANQTKDFKLKKYIVNYPLVDMITDVEEKVKKAKDSNPVMIDRGKKLIELYINNESDKYNVFASPILATKDMLMGLPPVLMIIAQKDMLHTENEKYAMMLADAGVEVKVKKFLNSGHGIVENFIQEFDEAHNLIIKTLKQSFYID